MSSPRLTDYLAHIAAAIERIRTYTDDLSLSSFTADERTQDAVLRNLEIIGEASHRIGARYPEFTAEHPELPVTSAYQMRNAVAHGYFEVDLDIVWKTIITDLPSLAKLIDALIAQQE
jgi:uncharacterized protein with HEPN domain